MKTPSACSTVEFRRGDLLLIAWWLTLAFSLATMIGPQIEARLVANGAGDDDPVARWLGDSRRMFANSAFVEADAYYHSGYYPTIYDNNAPFKTAHMAVESGTAQSRNIGDENSFMGQPHDWIEQVNRCLIPSQHTHLDEGGASGDLGKSTQVKEILPWLKISEKLDPQNVETYLVAAYWLRVRMHQVAAAEQCLRDALRANPGNAAILYEMGQLYFENRHDPARARNLYLAALDSWGRENSGKDQDEQDKFLLEHIASALFKLEKQEGNIPKAVEYLKLLKRVSPNPEAIQKRIDELQHASAAKP